MELTNAHLLDSSPIPSEEMEGDIWHTFIRPSTPSLPSAPAAEVPAVRPSPPKQTLLPPVPSPPPRPMYVPSGDEFGPAVEPQPELAPPEEEAPVEDVPTTDGGGGGGGGGGAPTAKETAKDTGVTAEKKILGMKPMYFYLLLAGVAVGGYFLFKKKKAA